MANSRLNIYLSSNDKKELDKIKYKYHLSYSTIANIIAIALSRQEFTNQFCNDRLFTESTNKKTSIKPRLKYEAINNNIYFDNVVKCFLRRELKNYLNEEQYNRINTKIYNEFQNTYEENWEGNKWHRLLPRMIKQNKEYYRRILDE